MKKFIGIVLALFLTAGVAVAAGSKEDPAGAYFTEKDLKMTPTEIEALKIGERWKNSESGVKPVAGADGSIEFIFGHSPTTLLCAVLQVTDVQLQVGEQVNNLNVGDTRWIVEPAITGYGEFETQHLIIKPMDTGLDTSLVVTTNRRTYHFRLKSDRKAFMPYVTFIYPDEQIKKWDAIKVREQKNRQNNTLADTGEYLGNLDFAYKVQGEAKWKPVRVYNDGVKTIIQMPSTMAQTEAPILLVLRGKKKEEVMVNYRVQSDRYIVDTLFDQAILIAGKGRSQDRVTITREAK